MLIPPCCLCLKTEESIDKSGICKEASSDNIKKKKVITKGDRKKQG